jgi:hypothetical protein
MFFGGLRLMILFGGGGGDPKMPYNFTLKKKKKILNEWLGFFETFGLQLFSYCLEVGLKKKTQMVQTTSSIKICVKFQQFFSFKGPFAWATNYLSVNLN